jgi:Cu(I)/Ag(I) efflux system membrane fusion protein
MASLKIKYAAMIISSLIAGGLISVTAYHYVNASEKAVKPKKQKRRPGTKGAFLV